MSLIVQIVFFVLTILAMTALYGFCSLLRMSAGSVTLVSSIIVAELLIWRAHFWRTGVESALWLGGLYAFILSLPHSGKPEAWLVLAAATALAGWRVRNALFGALAAVYIVVYFAALDAHWTALFFAAAIALIGLGGQTLEWKRPSTELLWQMLSLVTPAAGYLAIAFRNNHFVTDGGVVAFFLGVAFVCAVVGIQRRLRVPFIAATIAIVIAIIDARHYIPVSVEAELIMFGAVAMAIAGAITRSLRDKKTGFVLGVAKQSYLRDALSVAPTLLSVHGATTGGPTSSQHTGGGGEFGGAGASGNY
jgi:hypothetical protein